MEKKSVIHPEIKAFWEMVKSEGNEDIWKGLSQDLFHADDPADRDNTEHWRTFFTQGIATENAPPYIHKSAKLISTAMR